MSSMDAKEPAGAAPSPEHDEAADGVFGNLPRTRPGTRSARRDADDARRRRSAAAPAGEQPGAREPADAAQPSRPEDPDPESAGGIEDVAWAGVAAAAEAATIGVRLANRALEAMRDAVDRR
jgi:hypothetical protein